MKFKIYVSAYKEGVKVDGETFYTIDSFCLVDLELSEEEAIKVKQTIKDYNAIRDKIRDIVKAKADMTFGYDEFVFNLGSLLVEKTTRIKDRWSVKNLEVWEPEKK